MNEIFKILIGITLSLGLASLANAQCDPLSTFPWTENFDTYTSGATSFPDCWTAATRYSNYPYIENSTYANSSPNSLKFGGNNKPTAVTPQFAADIHTLQVTFQLKREGTSSGTFEVGVMSNPNDTSTFEVVQTITPTDNYYHEYTAYFTNTTLTGENNYIAFRQNSTSTAWYYWLDDVTVDQIPTCPPVSALTVTSLTATSAEISFTEQGTASAWQYVVSTTELEDPSTDTIEDANSNPFTISDLTANTPYFVYVRAYCSDDDQSTWESTTFRNECGAFVVDDENPFVEGFENEGQMPYCWSQEYVSGTQDWSFRTGGGDNNVSTAHGGTYNAYFKIGSYDANETYLISPILDLSACNIAKLSFWHTQPAWGNDRSELRVYYRTSADEAWALIPDAEFTGDIDEWTKERFVLPSTSATYQIAFKGTNGYSYGICLDDVTVKSAHTITASIDGDANGSIDPMGAVVVGHGEDVEFTVTANEGYRAEITVNGTPASLDENGKYTFTNVTEDGSIVAKFKSTTGIDIVSAAAISLYPNPAAGLLTIESCEEIRYIEVMAVTGQIVDTRVINATACVYDVTSLRNGRYIVGIHTDDGIITSRFVVMH